MRQPFLSITAKSTEQAELMMFGSVGEWRSLNAREVKRKLDQIKADGYKSVYCPMHCYGGEVYEGIAIRDVLRNSGLYIHIHVSGVAASMGSAILQGADKRTAHKFARIMIHEPSMMSAGNSKTLRQDADLLDTVKEDLAELYAESTGKDKQWILENWMKADEETWFNGAKAKLNGLLDEVTESKVDAPDASMNFGKIAAYYDEQLIKDTNQNEQMTQAELAKKVGLNADASIEEIEAKVAALEAAAQGAGGDNDTPEAQAHKKLVAAGMALARAKGMIKEGNEEKIKAKIEKDPEAAIEWIEMVTPEAKEEKKEAPKAGELSKLLAELKEKRPGSQATGEKKYADLTAEELRELEKTPEKLQALIKAEFKDSENPKV